MLGWIAIKYVLRLHDSHREAKTWPYTTLRAIRDLRFPSVGSEWDKAVARSQAEPF